MQEDGVVVIGTAVDTKQLEKDLKNITRQLEKYDKDTQKLTEKKAKLEFENKPLKEASEKYEALLRKVEEYKNTLRKLNEESQGIGTLDPEFGYYDTQKDKYRRLIAETNVEIEKGANSYAKVSNQLSKNQYQLDGINKKIQSNTRETTVLKEREEEITEELRNQHTIDVPNIANGISKIIGKVGKWALAVFSIRSAYMLVRQAVSTLASQDEQIGANLEYLRWVLAQTLKPIVEWMIQAVYTILAFVNDITVQLFNWNIFTGKTVADFNNARKNTKGIAGDLKEARKQLAGFDEMNVLNDNVRASGGADVSPNFPSPEEAKQNAQEVMQSWVDEFMDKYEELKIIREEMDWEDWFNIFGNWGLFNKGITDALYGIETYVIGAMTQIEGMFVWLHGISTGNQEEIQEGWDMMIDGLSLTIEGLLWTVIGVIETITGAVLGAVLSIFGISLNESDDAKTHLEDNSTSIKDSILGDADELGVKIGKKMSKFVYEDVPKFLAQLLLKGIEFYVKIKYFFEHTLPSFIRGVISGIVTKFGELGGKVGEAISGAFKSAVNGVLSYMETILNRPITAINELLDKVNTLPGVNIPRLRYFSLPRLAKGGIVNMPGRGVPVGSAIAGERGQEGVIPLTDSQQMDLLGASIGKHITINANITTTMNGRVISKELQKIQAENDFAFNR